MSLACCGCLCGSTESLIRDFLKRNGYEGWLEIPIAKGKEQSRLLLQRLPRHPEIQMLDEVLENTGKWAVIIGYDENNCRWSDLSHANPKTLINAEFIVKTFA